MVLWFVFYSFTHRQWWSSRSGTRCTHCNTTIGTDFAFNFSTMVSVWISLVQRNPVILKWWEKAGQGLYDEEGSVESLTPKWSCKETRMHSSRMRTTRSLTVSFSVRLREVNIFSHVCLSVYLFMEGGLYVTIAHDAFDFTIQNPPYRDPPSSYSPYD